MTAILTIAQAAELIEKRDVSPVELTEAAIARIEKYDGVLHSFVTPTLERARREAAAATAEIAAGYYRGPLHGIPYGLKDVFDTAGLLTAAQSRTLGGNVPATDSHAQERLQAAGAVLMGKNATWEHAHGGPSWDVLFPPACNPWNPEHSPAGSSSGSAAAVAAGLCMLAMGTDTGGSIRGPAAACGIAGIKPSFGRVSRRGAMPNSPSQDHVGPLAWCVEDLAIALNVLAGHDPLDPASSRMPVPDYRAGLDGSIKGLRIGVPYAWFTEESPVNDETLAAFEESLKVLRALGAGIETVRLPPLVDFEDTKKILALCELFSLHGSGLREHPELYGANFRGRVLAGGLVPAEDYLRAQRVRTTLAAAVQTVLTEVDLLALPTAEPAGKLTPVPASSLFTKLAFNAAFSVSGNPALALCNGFAVNGLPFSLQLVGRLFDEATILRVGHGYERATPWRGQRPTAGL
ncbi:amidase [Pelagibacterium sediminicola]|uniref:amidase n=1 Tax=Pelagibacterium sediminicola TaxID=2248761 RepID=UPI000E324D61|nr:amidase [Pelagibacterium sediminicola]